MSRPSRPEEDDSLRRERETIPYSVDGFRRTKGLPALERVLVICDTALLISRRSLEVSATATAGMLSACNAGAGLLPGREVRGSGELGLRLEAGDSFAQRRQGALQRL